MNFEKKWDENLDIPVQREFDFSNRSNYPFSSTIEKVIDYTETCPNCDEETYIWGKCKSCGIGGGDEYMREKREKKEQKHIESIQRWLDMRERWILQWNGKKYSLWTYYGTELSYYNYNNRIKENGAHLTFRHNGRRYDMWVEYEIWKEENYQEGTYYKYIKDVQLVFPEKNDGKRKIYSHERGVHFNYRMAQEFAKMILSRTEFNPYLEVSE